MKWLSRFFGKKTRAVEQTAPLRKQFLQGLAAGESVFEQNRRALAHAMLRTEPIPKLIDTLEKHVARGLLTPKFALQVLSDMHANIGKKERETAEINRRFGFFKPRQFIGDMREWREKANATLHDHPLSPLLIGNIGAQGFIESKTGKGVAIDLSKRSFNINLRGKK